MIDHPTALFPGTFDPFTNGHLDLTRRAARLFRRVVVAVAHNPAKMTLFSAEERVEMIQQATRGIRAVEVVDFTGLVVACARDVDAQVMIRGLRAVSDFEFEFQMALMNRRLSRSLEVAYLMPSQHYTYLNSSLVKEVARLGGSVRGLVPRSVEDRLRAKLGVVTHRPPILAGPGKPLEKVASKSAPRASATKSAPHSGATPKRAAKRDPRRARQVPRGR